MLDSTIESTRSCSWSSVMFRWKRFFKFWTVAAPDLKHGNCEPRKHTISHFVSNFNAANITTRNDKIFLHTRSHDLNKRNDLILVLSRSEQPLQDEYLKVLEHVGIDAAHDFDKLRRQLERRRFETQIPRRRRQDESEIDVNQMPIAVQQYITVVPVEHKK